MRALRLTPPEPNEKQIQDELMAKLQRRQWVVIRVNGGGFKTPSGFFWAYIVQGLGASKGFPDVLALRGGACGGGGACGLVEARLFEVKRAGGKLRPEQERFIAFAKRFGVGVEVVEGRGGLEALKL